MSDPTLDEPLSDDALPYEDDATNAIGGSAAGVGSAAGGSGVGAVVGVGSDLADGSTDGEIDTAAFDGPTSNGPAFPESNPTGLEDDVASFEGSTFDDATNFDATMDESTMDDATFCERADAAAAQTVADHTDDEEMNHG